MSSEAVREIERRKLNVMEGLILAALLFMGGTIFTLREAVVQLQTTNLFMAEEVGRLRVQFADVPALTTRVTSLELRASSLEKQTDELRATRSLK